MENITVEELAEFLRKPSHNCCSTKKATEILDRIKEDAVKERDYQFGRDFILRSIVRHIRYHCEELEKIETVLGKMLKEQKYQLQTLPGAHTVTACALIAHIGDIGRFRNANKLASYAGVAPPSALVQQEKERTHRIRIKEIENCTQCYICLQCNKYR